MIVVVSPGEGLETIGVEFSAGRVQLLAVVLRQLRAERVDRDDEGPTIGLELFEEVKNIAYCQKKQKQEKCKK